MPQDQEIILAGEGLDSFGDEAGGAIAAPLSAGLAVRLAESELNMHIVTARRFPRSTKRALDSITSLATMDEETAAECQYILKRDNKPLTGPSVRFAEIVASQWGNCHTGSRIVDVDRDAKVVVAEGVFWDLETGTKRVTQVRRSIATRSGGIFSNDMIVVTGNAAASIALREAVLRGVPKPVWRRAYEAAVKVVEGQAETLAQRRAAALKAWADRHGVTETDLCVFFGVEAVDELRLDHLAQMRVMLIAIKNQEAEVSTYFSETGRKPALGAKAKAAERAPEKPQETAKAAPASAPPPKPKAAPAVKPEPKEAAPVEETPHDPETGEVQESEGEPLAVLYEAILNNAMEDVAGARAFHAADLDRIQAEDPALYEQLQAELDAFEQAAQ